MQTVTKHESDEWLRLAIDADSVGRRFLAHCFRVSALDAMAAVQMPVKSFDEAMRIYRAWLVDGWPGVDVLGLDWTSR